MMGAHRVSPQMKGIMPRNIGGGDVGKASKVFFRNDLVPLQERIKEINEWIDEEVISFKTYDLEGNKCVYARCCKAQHPVRQHLLNRGIYIVPYLIPYQANVFYTPLVHSA